METDNTFITGFWIFCPVLTKLELNVIVNVNVNVGYRVGKGMPQLMKRACYLSVNIYIEVQ